MATNLLLLVIAIAATTATCTTHLITRHHIQEIIMSVQDTQAAVDAVTAQLTTAHDSIVAAINDASAQPDLTALQAAAQAIVDIAPTTPAA